MATIVQKYGGSSVADLPRIRRVAERIAASARAGDRVVVVCSAMGNTTNELLALAREVSPKPDRRELDMLVSVGERIAMSLLAMALHELGVPARSLTGSQSGIVTDEAHADARVVEVRPERLVAVLDAGEVAIVAGFQGVSRAREVTTLGRGGSDTTAVVLAAALRADHCEICSDVDGVWSADPRVVPEAIKLDALPLEQALALARGGAKVLFEDALQYARDHGVTLRASATFGPGSGTRLAAGGVGPRGPVAVTADTLARVDGIEDLGAAAAALAAAGGRVRRRAGGTLWVDPRNAHGGLPALGDWREVAVLTAVGSGLGADLGAIARCEARLPIAPTASGSSADAAWWELPVEAAAEATRAVHAEVLAAGPAAPQ